MTRIIDTTLRHFSDSSYVDWTREQSVELAGLLADVGVDAIEAGRPGASDGEHARVTAVVRAVDFPVLAQAEARSSEIEAVVRTGAPWIGIFVAVDKASSDAVRRGSNEIREAVTYAHDRNLRVRLTAEVDGGLSIDVVAELLDVGIASGADRICVADMPGRLEPPDVRAWIERLRHEFPRANLEVHFGDDRGLALANALVAADSGAAWIAASVNGHGRRAGTVDLATLLVNLHLRKERALRNGQLLPELSRRVGAYSRSMPDQRRPVVGRDVFDSEADSPGGLIGPGVLKAGLVGRSAHHSRPRLSREPDDWVVTPEIISSIELRYHRAGPGDRFVLVDDRFVPGADQYCIARRIPHLDEYGTGHVDTHTHHCDSLFVFLGEEAAYRGLSVEVTLGDRILALDSPASVFIPAGVPHGYRVVGGAGTYINHVLAGDYNSSLLDPVRGDR